MVPRDQRLRFRKSAASLHSGRPLDAPANSSSQAYVYDGTVANAAIRLARHGIVDVIDRKGVTITNAYSKLRDEELAQKLVEVGPIDAGGACHDVEIRSHKMGRRSIGLGCPCPLLRGKRTLQWPASRCPLLTLSGHWSLPIAGTQARDEPPGGSSGGSSDRPCNLSMVPAQYTGPPKPPNR